MFGLKFIRSNEWKQLKEEVTQYKRDLEDIGWINLSNDMMEGAAGMFKGQFKNMLKLMKIYYTKNPLAGLWVHLTTSFVFGEGISKPKCKDAKVQEIVDQFWDDPDNQKCLTSFKAQQLLSNKIQYEGNLFFVLFDDEEGNVKVRIFNSEEIDDIINDPEDRMRPQFYKIMMGKKEYDYASDSYKIGTKEANYYPCYDLMDPGAYGISIARLRDEARIMHFKTNCDINDSFGIPELYRGSDWIRAHKEMSEDLATLVKALSQFAWKKKIKGGAGKVQTIADALRSNLNLSNIKQSAGQMQIENEGMDLQSVDVKTGGVKIGTDTSRQMKLMVCAASGIFEHYFGDPSCYPIDTEALTEKGWKKIDEWKGEKVACFNPDKDRIEYHTPIEVHMFPYDGELISFKTSRQDIQVTPNHRMWTAKSHSDNSWDIRLAEELEDGSRWMFRNASLMKDNQEIKEHSDDWLRFIGYFVSEGHTLSPFKKDGSIREKKMMRIGISQHEGETLKRMRSTMKSLNFNGYEAQNQGGVVTLYTHDEKLWTWLREHCGTESHEKQIPEYIFQCSLRQQRLVLDTLIEGDGGHQGRENGTCIRYSTNSKILADQVQRLAFHQGWQSSIREEYDKMRRLIWRVNISKKRQDTCVFPYRISRIPYNGIVWCFQVPYGLFVTRRNGKIAIQGNTGNLATAKTMELPMVKKFTTYQKFWNDVYVAIFTYVINKKIEVGLFPGTFVDDKKINRRVYETNVDLAMDIDFPPVVEQDLESWAKALDQGKKAGLIGEELAAELFLLAANVNDVEEEIEKLRPEWEEAREREKFNMANGGFGGNGGGNGNGRGMFKAKEALREDAKAKTLPERMKMRNIRKENYVMQKMNGYRKSIAGHYRKMVSSIRENLKVNKVGDQYHGNVTNFHKFLNEFIKGMKESAERYYPVAIDIGEQFMQANLKDIKSNLKLNETLYEATKRGKDLLRKRLNWNESFLDGSLEPDMMEAFKETVNKGYETEADFKLAIYGAMSKFDSRLELYSGAFWTVEQEAVKEAGRGTGIMVNFVGPDDSHNCEGCEEAVNGGPYPIGDAPLPGEQECLGRCRHALQIVAESEVTENLIKESKETDSFTMDCTYLDHKSTCSCGGSHEQN